MGGAGKVGISGAVWALYETATAVPETVVL